MKFGIFVTQDSNFLLRCIDGVWTRLPPNPEFENKITAAAEKWEYYSRTPGIPCNQEVARTHQKECMTSIVSFARSYYGVPADVDLYVDGNLTVSKKEA